MAGVKGQKGTGSTEVSEKFTEGFLDAMDGRAEVVRTLRQRLGQLTADLGGLAQLSYQERSLVRRIIHLERHVERKELSLARGVTIDENSYLAAVNGLSGLLSKIGLQRRARQLPSLREYLSGTGKATVEPKATTPPNTATDQATQGQEDTQDGHHPPQPKETQP